MNWIDITLLTIIGYNGLTGFKRGLIRLIMDIIAFAAAIRTSSLYGGEIAKWLEINAAFTTPVATFTGYIGIWVITFGILSFIGSSVSRALPMVGLGTFNHIGGVIGGTIKGILICLPLLMPIQFFKPDVLQSSTLAPALAPAAEQLGHWLFPKDQDIVPEELNLVIPAEKK